MNIVPGIAVGTNGLAGRLVSLLTAVNATSPYGPYSAVIQSHPSYNNTATSVTLTFAAAHSFNVGDTVAITMLATTFSATTIGDNLLIENSLTNQYLASIGTEVGAVVRIISGTGSGIANDRKIISFVNGTGTIVYTVDTPFSPAPDGTSIFLIIAHDYFPEQHTHSIHISQPQLNTTQPTVIYVPNLTGMYLVEVLNSDASNNEQDPIQALWRYWWSTAKGSGSFPDTIVANTVTPDLAEGLAHEVLLNQAAQIIMEGPIWTGGVALPGVEITIHIIQDSAGGRPAPGWTSAYIGLTAADKQISRAPNTVNTYRFKMQSDNRWHLSGNPLIGKPIS
jgi:hypothetical protein